MSTPRPGSDSARRRASSTPEPSLQPDVDHRQAGPLTEDDLVALLLGAGGPDDVDAGLSEHQLQPPAQGVMVLDDHRP